MHRWVIPCCLLWAAASAGPAYRWVDESGQTHYSDRPVPGAEQFELVSVSPSAPSGPHLLPPMSAAVEVQTPRAAAYPSFAVIQPASDETLWGTGGVIDVALRIGPELQPGHRLGYYLDGEFTLTESPSTRFQLQDVHRGTHTLQAVILDEGHEEIVRSSVVTFYVQQTSIYYPRSPSGSASGN